MLRFRRECLREFNVEKVKKAIVFESDRWSNCQITQWAFLLCLNCWMYWFLPFLTIDVNNSLFVAFNTNRYELQYQSPFQAIKWNLLKTSSKSAIIRCIFSLKTKIPFSVVWLANVDALLTVWWKFKCDDKLHLIKLNNSIDSYQKSRERKSLNMFMVSVM